MKLLIVEPPPLPILIPLGSKYSPQDQFSNTLSLGSSLNVRDHASKPYSTTGNIIILDILIFKFLERSLEDKSVCGLNNINFTHAYEVSRSSHASALH